jgi:hypothetical protein
VSDRERSQRWRQDAGGARSRGRREPDGLFEILDAPLPSEVEKERARRERRPPADVPPREAVDAPAARERIDTPRPRRAQTSRQRRAQRLDPVSPYAEPLVEQQPEQPPPPARSRRRSAPARRARAATSGVRRVRRKIKHIDPLSALKVSLLLYTFFLLVWLVIVALIYNVLDGAGLFDQMQSLGSDLVVPALEKEVTLGQVERWALIVGVIGVLAGSVINAFLAFLYNVISDLVGGIEVTFQERDTE